MEVKDFIKSGDKLFIADSYGKDNLSNEEYDLVVEKWETLKKFLEWSELESAVKTGAEK